LALPPNNESNHTLEIGLYNLGDAIAIAPYVIIQASDDLTLSGCPGVLPHTVQCQAPDVLRKTTVHERFIVQAPARAGIYRLTVSVLTRSANGSASPFNEFFLLALPAVQQ
jgi:hypothetical protein